MMIIKPASAIVIFWVGEILDNLTVFRYLSRYFKKKKDTNSTDEGENAQPIFGMGLSLFKGILERFVLFVALIYGLTPILVVFGAFLVGNLISIQIAMVYLFIYNITIFYARHII